MGDLNLAWKVLYGEDRENVPDPNKPENVARINALAARRHKDLKVLFDGPGRPLLEMWRKNVMNLNMSLFAIPAGQMCGCPACEIIRKMQHIFGVWLEAEAILNATPKEG